MARLTWQDVAAPDFSTALEGYRTFSGLFNQGLNTAKQTVADFEKQKIDAVNQDALARLAMINDPNQANAQVQALLADPRANRLRAETILAAMARPNQVVDTAQGKLTFDTNKLEFDDNQKYKATLNAAGPQYAAWMAAKRTPGVEDDAAAEAAFAAATQGLPVNRLMGLQKEMTGQESSLLGIQNTRASMGREAERWDWDKLDRNEQREATALAEEIRAATGGEPDAAEARLNGLQGRSPQVMAAARRLLGVDTFRGYGDAGGMLAGAATGGGGYGSFLVNLESGGDPSARNQASSATGLHQFTKGTWLGTIAEAKPAWARGLNEDQLLALRTDPAKSTEMEQVLRNQSVKTLTQVGAPLTNANLYGMHHFGPESGRKFALAGENTPMSQILTREQLDANPYLKNLTKGQTMDNWSQRSGVSARVMAGAVDALENTATAAGQMEANAGNNLPNKFFELSTSGETPRQVAVRLAKENPGVNPIWLEKQIIDLSNDTRQMKGKNRGNVNAAIVGQAIMDTAGAQGARELFGRLIPDALAPNTIGEDLVSDRGRARDVLQGYVRGDMDDTIAANTVRASSQGELATARAQLQSAQARLQAKIQTAAARGIKNPNFGPEFLAVQQATIAVQEAQNMRGAPGNQAKPDPKAGRPAPPPAQRAAPTSRPAATPAAAALQRTATGPSSKAPKVDPGEQRKRDQARLAQLDKQIPKGAMESTLPKYAPLNEERRKLREKLAPPSSLQRAGEAARNASVQNERRNSASNMLAAKATPVSPQRRSYLANRARGIEAQLKQPLPQDQKDKLQVELRQIRSQLN